MVDRIYDGTCAWPLGTTQSTIFAFIGDQEAAGRTAVRLSDVVAHVKLSRSTVRESTVRLISRGLLVKTYDGGGSVFRLSVVGWELRGRAEQ